jgi:hypothetical protein
LVLAVRGPGDLLGELSAFDGAARSANVVALGNSEAAACANWPRRPVRASPPRKSRKACHLTAWTDHNRSMIGYRRLTCSVSSRIA